MKPPEASPPRLRVKSITSALEDIESGLDHNMQHQERSSRLLSILIFVEYLVM